MPSTDPLCSVIKAPVGAWFLSIKPVVNTSLGGLAFENPDGGRVLIVSNRSPDPEAIWIKDGGRQFFYRLPAQGAATFTWESALYFRGHGLSRFL